MLTPSSNYDVLIHDDLSLESAPSEPIREVETPGNMKPNNIRRMEFLERNRQAAQKSRQRKKAWVASLQVKVDYLESVNRTLHNTVESLNSEVTFLKSQLNRYQCLPDVERASGSHQHLPTPGISSYETQHTNPQHLIKVASPMVSNRLPKLEHTSLTNPTEPLPTTASYTLPVAASRIQYVSSTTNSPSYPAPPYPTIKDVR